MSIFHFVRLLLKNRILLLLTPVLIAGSIYFFTKGEKKMFTSETVIYTGIASGYTLNGNNKADFFAASNAFDNLLSLINSRETKTEVAVSLLAKHLMLTSHDTLVLGWEAWKDLQEIVSLDLRRNLIMPTEEATKQKIAEAISTNENHPLYKIINSNNPYYSINAMRAIKPVRINNSDLIKVSYETNDPVICKTTLELMLDIFIKKHRNLRDGQTSNVIAYFEKEVEVAFARLDSCEQVFLNFNKQNEIINFYEQTKAVAGEKEDLYTLDHSLRMDRKAKEKAVDKVNDNLKGKIYQSLYGGNIIDQREELAKTYSNIALYEGLNKNSSGSDNLRLDSLKKISASLEKKLYGSMDELYIQSNTPKGIPTKTVLDEWVKTTLEFEQSKARLSLMDSRKSEFDKEYQKFAPLGAILKKIERQINVAEKAYLELLHGLNMAKLTQQNNEISSQLTIVDPPYLPLKYNTSKRKMLIVVGFIAGFISVLTFLLTKFFLNNTLQEPAKAYKKIGLPLLGIYPLLNVGEKYLAKANLRLMQQLITKFTPGIKPLNIGVISNKNGEGKTTLIETLKKEFTQLGYQVSSRQWNEPGLFYAYSDINFIEFQALENIILTPKNTPPLNHAIFVCRANRSWSLSDKDLVNIFSKNAGIQPALVLNGVNIDFAEDIIGEKHKKRFFYQSFFKRILKLEIGNRSKF